MKIEPKAYDDSNHTIWTGGAIRSLSEITEIDFDQPRSYWNSLSSTDQKSLTTNLANSLSQVKYKSIIKNAIEIFKKVDIEFSKEIMNEISHMERI